MLTVLSYVWATLAVRVLRGGCVTKVSDVHTGSVYAVCLQQSCNARFLVWTTVFPWIKVELCNQLNARTLQYIAVYLPVLQLHSKPCWNKWIDSVTEMVECFYFDTSIGSVANICVCDIFDRWTFKLCWKIIFSALLVLPAHGNLRK